MWKIVVWAVMIAWAIVIAWITRSRLGEHLSRRRCQGRSWLRAFPDASKAEIRDFLALLAEAFGLYRSERMKLSPEDRVMEVYGLLYPHPEVTPDCLELETLARLLEDQYGLDLERACQDDVSLGALFALTRGTCAA